MIRVRVSGPTFNNIFIVRIKVIVISVCDVTLNMHTAVGIKLQTEKCFFYPPSLCFMNLGSNMIAEDIDFYGNLDPVRYRSLSMYHFTRNFYDSGKRIC